MKNKDFTKAVVIFIDVLGTRGRTEFDEWYQIADIFYNTVQREKKLDETHEWAIYKREIHMFSDCAYIIYDYKEGIEEKRKNLNALMAIACYNTEKVLYEFLKKEFIARGALTYGDIYYESDRNFFFGPAMNTAYDLENKVAKYPRIIIDPMYAEDLVKYIEKTYQKDDSQKRVNGQIVKKDKDGKYFIHFLNTLESGMNWIDGREVIKKALKLCYIEKSKIYKDERTEKSIKEKYEWLEMYINNLDYIDDESEYIDITNTQLMSEIASQELKLIKNIYEK